MSVGNCVLLPVKKCISSAIVILMTSGFAPAAIAEGPSPADLPGQETQKADGADPQQGAASSYEKIEELTLFWTEHQADIKQTEGSGARVSNDIMKMFSAVLDDRKIPAMLQAFDFLLYGTSPDFRKQTKTAEETARFYLKVLKHPNPVVRLYGLSALQQFKEQAQKLPESQAGEHISRLKQIIKLVEADYSPTAEDSKLLEQHEKCVSYLDPVLSTGGNKNFDASGFISNFGSADRAVQFFLAFKISMATMISQAMSPQEDPNSRQLKQILAELADKSDNYTRGLAAVGRSDEDQINKLLKDSTDPDEFITLGTYLSSCNVPIAPYAWPEKEKLSVLLDKASLDTRRHMLELMKITIEFQKQDN
jgi:hypothetical protein